jgi:hypothetical protein
MDANMLATLQEFKSMPIVVKLTIREGGDEFAGFCQKGFTLKDEAISFEFDLFMGLSDRKVVPHYTLIVKIEDVLTISAQRSSKLTVVTYSETITIDTLAETHTELYVALLEKQQT